MPLTALTHHLFLHFTDRELASQKTVELDGREALRSELTARLDGVPKHFVIYVLKKDGCVYDFMHIAPPRRRRRTRASNRWFERSTRCDRDPKPKRSSSARGRLSLGMRVPVRPKGFFEQLYERAKRLVGHVGQVSEMAVGSVTRGVSQALRGSRDLAAARGARRRVGGHRRRTSVFIGMVMAVQFAFGLRKFGGMEYTGRVIALSFARELAPTLTAVIVGGRIGSGMAAEVGAMNVTEQIDAVRRSAQIR